MIILKSKFVQPNDTYPKGALQIFEENTTANIQNATMLNSINNEIQYIQAPDKLYKNVAPSKIEQALNCNQSETDGLAKMLKLKFDARVMLTVNVNLEVCQ